MAGVTDAQEAIEMVRDRWTVGMPEWYSFRAHKQGYTWIVTYRERFIDGDEEHEVRINAQTGNMVTIK
jgi:hypothetical protein